MAIQSIPETVQKQARGTHSLSSFQDNDEENQHGRESGYVSTNAATASSTEFWICIWNTLSYVILMVAILTNSVNLLSLAQKEHYTYRESTLVFTLIQFIIAYATISFIIAVACCSTKDPTKETGASSLVGSLMTALTSVFLLICLIFVVLGLGKQKIQPLSWNTSNNIKELDHSIIITQESYTYELKPVAYSSASDSEDFYDILATMNYRILSLEATKEFLNKFDCDNNRFPTLAIQHISLFGSMGSFNSYPVSNLDCGPV